MSHEKEVDIKNLCMDNCIGMLGIQETKMIRLDLFLVRSIWGNYEFDVVSSGARGRSGGLLIGWDPVIYKKTKVWSIDNLLIVEGEVLASCVNCYLITMYAS